jgi:hypothetical protein
MERNNCHYEEDMYYQDEKIIKTDKKGYIETLIKKINTNPEIKLYEELPCTLFKTEGFKRA